MCASRRTQTEVITSLIKAGANVEVKDKFERTAIINASLHGNSEVVDVLIKAGADMEAKDNNGDTALSLAFLHGHIEIVKSIIEAGANIDDKNVTMMLTSLEEYIKEFDIKIHNDVSILPYLNKCIETVNLLTNHYNRTHQQTK